MTNQPKILDARRLIWDYEYYAAKLLHIKDQNQQLIPLDFWSPQNKFHQVVEDARKKGKLQRFIILKARREGMSTYCEGRLFWCSHMNAYTDAAIIAHEKESGQKIFNMCKVFFDYLPKQFQPLVRFASKNELAFENPDPKTRSTNPGLRSSLTVLTAGKKDVARGAGYHNLHCSEVSSWSNPEDVIPALMPTVPKTLDSMVFFESTAKGVGNYFHSEWLAAKEGVSNFIPFFLAWYDLPEYTRQFNHGKERAAFIESLNDEEKELSSVYRLTPEQLYWRRTTIADLRADVELFRQEYPANDEEAFVVSGAPLFDRRKLRMMMLKCKPPKWRGSIDHKGPTSNDQGAFRIWKHPEANGIYVMGIDVSAGGRYDPRTGKTKGDFSCIEVWKKLPIPLTAEQVAEWHGYVDPFNFAEIIESIGRLYNDALASVEVEGYGMATLQELQAHYWNIYRQERVDTYDGSFTNKLGWQTNLRSKKALISFGTHCVSDMSIIVHSEDLVREFITFVQDDSGGGSAAGTGYDDRVMAALIGLYTMYRHVIEEPADSHMFQTRKSPISSNAHMVDREFAQILEYGHDDSYEDHWLNY
uniref:Putative terminase n=1 Tax=viral metagenome TaxID=1070528 RepID=A0A6M3K077_9ZZZZ